MAERTDEEKRADYAKRAEKAAETRRLKAEAASAAQVVEAKLAEAKPATTAAIDEPIDIQAGTEINMAAGLGIKPGDDVYLTVRASQDLTIGPVTLSSRGGTERRCGTIPDNATVRDLHRWDRALKLRIITLGKLDLDQDGKVVGKPINTNKFDKRDPNALHICVDYLDSHEKLRDLGIGLSRVGTHVSGWHPKELLEEVRKHESGNGNRRKFLDFLDTAMEAVGHVSFVDRLLDPEVHLKADLHYDARILPNRSKKLIS